MDKYLAAAGKVLLIPAKIFDLVLSDTRLTLVIIVVVVAVVATVARRFQRCPHCRAWVRRAGDDWQRCPHCGRQYHRGLKRV